MKLNPLVSIVIPVYNGANYMREAIDSALAQTYKNIEIIVVNDGSTDDTRKIALSYGDKIRYFEKENGGVSTALNLGIRKMKGEYFSWLSHDDLYAPEKVEAEIETLKMNGNMDMAVHCNYNMLYMSTGQCLAHLKCKEEEQKFLTYGALLPLLGLVTLCSVLIPKKYFDEYGGFNPEHFAVQDYEKFFEMFRGKRLFYLEQNLITIRQHDTQATRTYQKRIKEERWLFKFMLEQLNDEDLMDCGLDKYTVFCSMCEKYREEYPYLTQKFAMKYCENLIEPKDAEERRKNLQDYLCGLGDGGIYLYSAGIVGRRLIRQLKSRNIEIDGISDSDPNKQQGEYYGVTCLPLQDIPKKSLIIVSKAFPEDVIDLLSKKGYKNVIAYNDLKFKFICTPLRKNALIDIIKTFTSDVDDE